MTQSTQQWIHGLAAAAIGGGASAVTATVTASMLAPDKFNLAGQLHNFMELAVITFLMNGFLSAMAYLKQSPLPPEPPPQQAMAAGAGK